MKLSVYAIALGAAAASAQSIGSLVAKIPSCAQPCFLKDVPKVCSSITDYGCQCQAANKAKLTTLIQPCVLSGCSTSEALETQKLTTQICQVYEKSGGSSGGSSSAPASSSMAMSSSAPMKGKGGGKMPTSMAMTSTEAAATSVSAVAASSSMASQFTGAAPLATAAPLGAAIAAAVAFAL